MIFDEESLYKTLGKAHNFTAIGLAVGASAANAFTAGVAVTSIATTVVGAGVTMMGQMQAGEAANVIAQRNAQIQLRDAAIAKQNAEFNARIQETEDDKRRRAKRARAGATGIVLDEGTNLLAQAEQEYEDEINAQLIRRGGRLQSQGLQQQAIITSASGTAARSAGYISSGASLLAGGGQALKQTATFRKQGVFS